MKRIYCALAFTTITTCHSVTAFGQTSDYYSEPTASKGYYWYIDPKQMTPTEEKQPEAPPEKVETPEEKTTEVTTIPTKKVRRLPDMKDHPMEEIMAMHPDDFQELLMDFQKKAVMEPSVQNVRDYKVMEDVARRKSLMFANVASYVQQTDSSLNMEKDFPQGGHGRAAYTMQRYNEVVDKLKAGKEQFGLLFFTQENCGQCVAQKPILDALQQKTGWEIKELTGENNPEAFKQFNIKTTPTIILVENGKPETETVVTGTIGLDELETRLYRSVRMALGETTPQDYSTYGFQEGGAFDPRAMPDNNPVTNEVAKPAKPRPANKKKK